MNIFLKFFKWIHVFFSYYFPELVHILEGLFYVVKLQHRLKDFVWLNVTEDAHITIELSYRLSLTRIDRIIHYKPK